MICLILCICPTYTAAAWYHKNLSELQKDFNKSLEEAKQFALNDYTLRIDEGKHFGKMKKIEIVQKLASLRD